MNFVSFVILAVIIVAVILAIRYSVTHHSSCADCGGSCSSHKSCHSKDKTGESFRQQRLEDLWKKTQA